MAGGMQIIVKMNKLPQASGNLRAAMRDVLSKFQLDMEAHAGATVPVDTGTLKNSVSHELTDISLTIRWEAPYAGFVNFGTRFMAARPFVSDAVTLATPGLQAAMAEIEGKLT